MRPSPRALPCGAVRRLAGLGSHLGRRGTAAGNRGGPLACNRTGCGTRRPSRLPAAAGGGRPAPGGGRPPHRAPLTPCAPAGGSAAAAVGPAGRPAGLCGRGGGGGGLRAAVRGRRTPGCWYLCQCVFVQTVLMCAPCASTWRNQHR